MTTTGVNQNGSAETGYLMTTSTATGVSTPVLIAILDRWAQTASGTGGAIDNNGTLDPFIPQLLAEYGGNGNVTLQDIRNQLFASGYSRAQITRLVTSQPSTLKRLLTSLAGSFVTLPLPEVGPATDAAADGTATGAAEGAAAGAGVGAGAGTTSGLESLVKKLGLSGSDLLFLPLIVWLTTESNWVRVLEVLGGAVAIGLAFRELAQ